MKTTNDRGGRFRDILEATRLLDSSTVPEKVVETVLAHLCERLGKRARCAFLEGEDLTLRFWAGGCRTLTAGNGEEALQALHAKPFVDVVVTGVALPVMGGLELLRTVRQIDGFKTLPVILCLFVFFRVYQYPSEGMQFSVVSAKMEEAYPV